MTAPRPIAVVDIDGVVADVSHRLGHLRSRPVDWEGFFAAAAEDPPLPDGVVAVRTLARDHEVVWLSGRPERLRAVTAAWLARQGLPGTELHLRHDSDRRPAAVTKAERMHVLVAGREVALVLDDDTHVVAALRRDGWPVALADWAPVPRHSAGLLERAQEVDGRT